MIVETRKTARGTEYWDNVEKRTLFVPAGKKPGFDVTVKPKSMVEDGHNANVGVADEVHPSLKDLNKEQLLNFAEQNEIDVPGNMSKEETIRKYIAESLDKE